MSLLSTAALTSNQVDVLSSVRQVEAVAEAGCGSGTSWFRPHSSSSSCGLCCLGKSCVLYTKVKGAKLKTHWCFKVFINIGLHNLTWFLLMCAVWCLFVFTVFVTYSLLLKLEFKNYYVTVGLLWVFCIIHKNTLKWCDFILFLLYICLLSLCHAEIYLFILYVLCFSADAFSLLLYTTCGHNFTGM